MKYLLFLFISCTFYSATQAQYKIEPQDGYTTQIGILVDMLEDLKDRITNDVKDLSQEETDFLFDEKANSIGALIMHLVATELYYQIETLEEREWTTEESELLAAASNLGGKSREKYKGKTISFYLEIWDDIRAKSLQELKLKDDEWLASDIDESINNYFVWYHVLEHQANHMGQIALVKNRFESK